MLGKVDLNNIIIKISKYEITAGTIEIIIGLN